MDLIFVVTITTAGTHSSHQNVNVLLMKQWAIVRDQDGPKQGTTSMRSLLSTRIRGVIL